MDRGREEPKQEFYAVDFRQGQLDDVIQDKLETAFLKPTPQISLHDIVKIATEHDPIDLAHTVSRLPPASRVVVYDNLPDLDAKITFMIHTSAKTRYAIFKQIDDNEIKRLMENMPPDEAVWMLDDMSDRRMRRVLELIDPIKAKRICELQEHDRQSAGRIMSNEFFAFPMNTTVGEVSAHIRDNPGIELTSRVYVLSDENKLAGYVPGRNLIINPPSLPLRQVMRPVLQKATAETSRDEVVDLIERYNLPALPIVDEDDHLVGVVTQEDAVEAMKDIADETIASIAGTAEDLSEEERPFQRFLWRAPWLLVTLCAGLINATTMSHFQDRVWFAIVPFFVPLIAGMSGNVGIQCSTILVRGISTGELTPNARRSAMGNEIFVGLLIGCVFGVICGSFVYLMHALGIHHAGTAAFAVSATVGLGILGACFVATLLGTFSPVFFARWRIDPAVASGPIVTAFNDVLSTLMFFLVAWCVYYLFTL